MKIFIALMILSIAPSVFAEGSWELNCVGPKGISFSSSNGLSEIQSKNKVSEIEIEKYDVGFSSSQNSVKWIGSPKIISETIENDCNSDHATTIFSQKVKITLNGKSSVIEVMCTDSVSTSSGISAEENSCSEQL